ncbi:MAG: argininosuccinate lyase [Elusimicrobia bacterium]|nr:argininosuccinate lyase [Elusimicrobiota bacterium]
MKLWRKGGKKLAPAIERFTVGNDYLLDQKLLPYDCDASLAHAAMLKKTGILSASELALIERCLKRVKKLSAEGKFRIRPSDEDCHTAIENYLARRCGKAGLKIHTGRSRNDQVLTALRLYEKDELKSLAARLTQFKTTIARLAKSGKGLKMPGYTHTRRAMPTTWDTWLSAFSAAADDNIILLTCIRGLLDKSPLGTAAGFGLPSGIDNDRAMTARLMGFAGLIENPVCAQLGRGKLEASVLHLCSQIMLDLSRLSADIILFSTPEFGLLKLGPEICTGSSIMPQKRNPDVFELLRAKYAVVLAEEFKVKAICGGLPSGYNRDLQLTKEPLMSGLQATQDSLEAACAALGGVQPDSEGCAKALTAELYSAEAALKMAKAGIPFRAAYRKASKKFPAR